MNTKFIFITGGVVSSLGKGITAASIGLLLKSRGLSVVNQKCDPYLNIDPGTMNPYQHGEVFVTEDGGETDLDLGHYERFTDVAVRKFNSTTAGKVYLAILDRERNGEYDGGTVQVVPHVTDEIQSRIMRAAEQTNPDIVITEIGGTVGDIESLPFIEAIRQIRYAVGKDRSVFIHLGLLPYLKECGEIKTKPMQHSVKELLGFGIQPDIIMCRSEKKLTQSVREKLSLFCNVDQDAIIENLTAKSIYEVPLMLEKAGLGKTICKLFHIEDTKPELTDWEKMLYTFYHPEKEITVALVGKYIELPDAYLSVSEALTAAGIYHKTNVKQIWIDAEKITSREEAEKQLKDVAAIIVPGGFGDRGVEGMVFTAEYARTKKIPYFGICLGMQVAVIEFARHVLHLENASSTEFQKHCEHPVIDLMPDQQGVNLGGTLRLGLCTCSINQNTLTEQIYKQHEIRERHRHRYEFNNIYRTQFEESEMTLAGINPERNLVEIIELKNHPWYVAVQFHPEFASRPNRPHPLFREFIGAAIKQAGV
ncbi:CTP synthase [Treponema phagedenis]|uniref:CTP synthase n=1 Tax=Treponema phagedenis TaxID=162 RepID=A0A0B7GX09_TREPH|nr:CTP synthase [Treponema phagedenis]NVP25054.1 CTP synthase [Treponema phagedenis]QEJ94034.1 CTP synthase [Treponema phagedenis]QEJ97168.1 CTP synthase [Treponema phagedenis]QEK01958.1 CTP synthase [Treponema phagedenis]QEK02642.1 CTP synthase [Treponema phagedenis]